MGFNLAEFCMGRFYHWLQIKLKIKTLLLGNLSLNTSWEGREGENESKLLKPWCPYWGFPGDTLMTIKGFANAKILNITTPALFSTQFWCQDFWDAIDVLLRVNRKLILICMKRRLFHLGNFALGICWIFRSTSNIETLTLTLTLGDTEISETGKYFNSKNIWNSGLNTCVLGDFWAGLSLCRYFIT